MDYKKGIPVGHTWQSYLLKSSLDGPFSNQVENYLLQFENSWKELFPTPQYELCQLDGGSRLRPTIAFLGYLISPDSSKTNISSQIVELGISIEMIHKASLLIDDIIDRDEFRNGVKTFHIVNGEDKALAMATYLIGSAFNKMAISIDALKPRNNLTRYMELSGAILKDMSEGLMMELGMFEIQKSRLDVAKEIINKETASIIKNALTLGYLIRNPENPAIVNSLKVIGESCGYIFQIMNDIEPFGDADKRALNKGNSVIEFYNDRKNVIVSYIFQMLNEKQRQKLLEIQDKEKGTKLLKQYFYQLEVWPNFKLEFQEVVTQIDQSIEVIGNEGISESWCKNCKSFVRALIKIAEGRLHLQV
ncbi:MAG: polyprenyl synthetase family protein [Cytophagales bacterium]|nr:polyprenyl synthetase family protein [Cytophagales bacterium]